ncbi:hypothetical protein ACLB2K_024015 [Fragaria x ananassa]
MGLWCQMCLHLLTAHLGREPLRVPVCSFHEMAEYFNKKSGYQPGFPWEASMPFNLETENLVLRDEIKCAVPYSWDPAALASFIENFGTHMVISVTIGGRDVVYIRQHQSSPLSLSDIRSYVKDIGDDRFLESKGHSSAVPLKYKDKVHLGGKVQRSKTVVGLSQSSGRTSRTPATPSSAQRPDGSSSSHSNNRNSEDKKEKLAKLVDLTEMSKGPQDTPGYWLVTGAKLGVDKGKIVLRVEYSLLNY